MSNSTKIASITFFVLFLFFMTAGINNSMVRLDSMAISGKNMACSNPEYQNLLTQPNLIMPVTSEACKIQADINKVTGGATDIFSIFTGLGCLFIAIENAVIGAMNVIIMGATYVGNFVGVLFSPCSVFADNPLLYAMIFIPIIIACIVIAVETLKP